MQLVVLSRLRAGRLTWQTARGQWSQTVVCKVTYRLQAGGCSTAHELEDINDSDNHWNDDTACSLYLPSDLVPYKPRVDVLLVGNAFAPGGTPVRSLVARVVVGSMDKSLEVNGDRQWQRDGSAGDPSAFARMPLRWERAAAATENPVGLRPEDAAVPNLLVPGSILHRAKPIDAVGFGPVAPDWGPRRSALRGHASSFSHARWRESPLPDDLDYGYFNTAPRDQQIAELGGGDILVLENLNPHLPKVAARLPQSRPRAFVEPRDGTPQEIALVCDTLWIDTDRSICTLTWRGRTNVDGPQPRGRVLIGLESPDHPVDYASLRRRVTAAQEGTRAMEAYAIPDDKAALPFAGSQPRAAPEHGSPATGRRVTAPDTVDDGGETAHDFAASSDALPAWMRHAGRLDSNPPPISAPKPAAAAPPPPVHAVPPNVAMAQPAGEPARVAASPWASRGDGPADGQAAAAVLVPPPGPAPHPRFWPQPLAEPTAPQPAVPVSAPPAAEPAIALKAAPRAAELIELLWYDPASMQQLRETEAFEHAIRSAEPPPIETGFDDEPPPEERPEVKDRRELVAVMQHAGVTDEEGIREAIGDAVRDDGAFRAPLVLVAADLALPFDEIDTLKAAVALTKPVAGADPKLKEAVDNAEELLKTGLALASAADKLTVRIREAFQQSANRVLPANYLETQLDRALLVERRYQRRTVFGITALRGLVGFGGAAPAVPTYLPDTLAAQLPMYQSFRVRVVAEAHLQQDQYEAHPAALRVVALGRVARPPARSRPR
jgi:hypothetical protein